MSARKSLQLLSFQAAASLLLEATCPRGSSRRWRRRCRRGGDKRPACRPKQRKAGDRYQPPVERAGRIRGGPDHHLGHRNHWCAARRQRQRFWRLLLSAVGVPTILLAQSADLDGPRQRQGQDVGKRAFFIAVACVAILV